MEVGYVQEAAMIMISNRFWWQQLTVARSPPTPATMHPPPLQNHLRSGGLQLGDRGSCGIGWLQVLCPKATDVTRAQSPRPLLVSVLTGRLVGVASLRTQLTGVDYVQPFRY